MSKARTCSGHSRWVRFISLSPQSSRPNITLRHELKSESQRSSRLRCLGPRSYRTIVDPNDMQDAVLCSTERNVCCPLESTQQPLGCHGPLPGPCCNDPINEPRTNYDRHIPSLPRNLTQSWVLPNGPSDRLQFAAIPPNPHCIFFAPIPGIWKFSGCMGMWVATRLAGPCSSVRQSHPK